MKKIVSGTVTSSGRLAMYMGEVNDFLSKHKGQRIVVTFEPLGREPSEALKGYYFNYVIPTMQQAIWESGDRKTKEQTEEWLRSISPVTQEESYENGRYHRETIEFKNLSTSQLCEHIDWIKQLAAEEYSTFINDPQ